MCHYRDRITEGTEKGNKMKRKLARCVMVHLEGAPAVLTKKGYILGGGKAKLTATFYALKNDETQTGKSRNEEARNGLRKEEIKIPSNSQGKLGLVQDRRNINGKKKKSQNTSVKGERDKNKGEENIVANDGGFMLECPSRGRSFWGKRQAGQSKRYSLGGRLGGERGIEGRLFESGGGNEGERKSVVSFG